MDHGREDGEPQKRMDEHGDGEKHSHAEALFYAGARGLSMSYAHASLMEAIP